MWIRIPVVPGYTDSPGNISGLAHIIRDLKTVERVDLLPYHRLGESKYRGLGIKYGMAAGVAPPSKENMARFAEIMRNIIDRPVLITWE